MEKLTQHLSLLIHSFSLLHLLSVLEACSFTSGKPFHMAKYLWCTLAFSSLLTISEIHLLQPFPSLPSSSGNFFSNFITFLILDSCWNPNQWPVMSPDFGLSECHDHPSSGFVGSRGERRSISQCATRHWCLVLSALSCEFQSTVTPVEHYVPSSYTSSVIGPSDLSWPLEITRKKLKLSLSDP